MLRFMKIGNISYRRIITLMALLTSVLVNVTTVSALEIEVSGNGSNSENTANISQESTVNVQQSNDAKVSNDTNSQVDPGNNQADTNNGEVLIQTGDAISQTEVTNDTNKSVADIQCCPQTTGDIAISGNGADSRNDANIDQNNSVQIHSHNEARIYNDVHQNATTGNNQANKNVGDTAIITGDASSIVSIKNEANKNIAKVECCVAQQENKEQGKDKEEEQAKEKEQVVQEEEKMKEKEVITQVTEKQQEAAVTEAAAPIEQVQAAIAQLPITGLNLWLMAEFAILMMAVGVYAIRMSKDPRLWVLVS